MSKLILIIIFILAIVTCDRITQRMFYPLSNGRVLDLRDNLPLANPDDESVQKANIDRKIIGIRLIQDDWAVESKRFARSQSGLRTENWTKPDDPRVVKCVEYRDETIVSEQDIYRFGGIHYSEDPDGGKVQDLLSITYDYDLKKITLYYRGPDVLAKNAVLNVFIDEANGRIVTNKEKIKVAQDILSKFGMKIDE